MKAQPKKVLILFLLVSLLLAGLISSQLSGSMDENGQMSHCLFMNDTVSVCPMTLWQHIAQWQQIDLGLIVGWFFSIALVLAVFYSVGIKVSDKYNKQRIRWKQYFSQHHKLRPFRPLVAALAQGIIQPKVYLA